MISFRLMIRGVATGKGLNVKGKSAKKGVVSGLVPFLQISNEADKAKVEVIPIDARIRVFFPTDEQRETAKRNCLDVRQEMHDAFSEAKKKQEDSKGMTNGKSEK